MTRSNLTGSSDRFFIPPGVIGRDGQESALGNGSNSGRNRRFRLCKSVLTLLVIVLTIIIEKNNKNDEKVTGNMINQGDLENQDAVALIDSK